MSFYESVATPRLTPETVRACLVDDEEGKRAAVVESLAELGLAHGLVEFGSYEAAHEFMTRQVPGQLEANVFIIDGRLNDDLTARPQGNLLAGTLFDKFLSPLMTTVTGFEKTLKEEGLSKSQIQRIINISGTYKAAEALLNKEALLVGISRVDRLNHAQIPIVSPIEVGLQVYNAVVPEAVRNKIAKRQRKDRDRARSNESKL